MSTTPDHEPCFDRLQQALDAWLDFLDQGVTRGPEEFLRTVDPELHPLLEPMLAAQPEPASSTPRRIGSYRILSELGRGGMGTVFEAYDETLERTVALKVLNAQIASSSAAQERFRREGAAAARLRHPGIVKVFGIGTTDGTHWIAMEKIDGESLADRLQRAGSLGVLMEGSRPAEVAAIGLQIAEALEYAHSQQIIHRDIKPHNILIGEDHRAHIVDFGLAKIMDRKRLSTTGNFAGSLSYASPEQLAGARDIDARTDVWSLGVLLYESLAGTRPFDAETHEAVAHHILTREPTPPKGPRDLQTICLKALTKEPQNRFASAGAMAADLRRFLDHEPIQAALPGTVSRIMRSIRRRRALSLSFAAAILLGVLATWFWIENREQAGVASGFASSAQSSLAELERLFRGEIDRIGPHTIRLYRPRILRLIQDSEELLAVQPDDPSLIRVVVRAHQLLAQVEQRLKFDSLALAAHRRATRLLRKLLTKSPDDPVALHMLAVSLLDRHTLHREMGREPLANADLQQAITHWNELLASPEAKPVRRPARIFLAAALSSRARAQIDTAAASEDLERASALWRKALPPRVENASVKSQRAVADPVLARSLETRTLAAKRLYYHGDLHGADQAVRDVIQAIPSRAKNEFQSVAMVGVHIDALLLRGEMLTTIGDTDLALADAQRSLSLSRKLAGNGATDHVIKLAETRAAVASLCLEKELFEQAEQLLGLSDHTTSRILERLPNLVSLLRLHADIARLKAELQVRRNVRPADIERSFVEALRALKSLATSAPTLGISARLARTHSAYGAWLLGQDRRTAACEAQSRAVDEIIQALQRTPRHPGRIRLLAKITERAIASNDTPALHRILIDLATTAHGAAPRDPEVLRIAIGALDRTLARQQAPGQADQLAARILKWIDAADAMDLPWRDPAWTDSLTIWPRHLEVGPRLRAPSTADKK